MLETEQNVAEGERLLSVLGHITISSLQRRLKVYSCADKPGKLWNADGEAHRVSPLRSTLTAAAEMSFFFFEEANCDAASAAEVDWWWLLHSACQRVKTRY